MQKKTLNGILSSGFGSLWWGVVGVLYFKSVSHVTPLELTIHRTVWTAFLLIFVISIFKKWNDFFIIIKNLKILIYSKKVFIGKTLIQQLIRVK